IAGRGILANVRATHHLNRGRGRQWLPRRAERVGHTYTDRVEVVVVRAHVDGALGADGGRGPHRAAGVVAPQNGPAGVDRHHLLVVRAHVDHAVRVDGRRTGDLAAMELALPQDVAAWRDLHQKSLVGAEDDVA